MGISKDQPDFRQEESVVIQGVEIDLVRLGSGKPVLFLHSVDGIHPDAEPLKGLSQNHEVFAPWHPGFGYSERPEHFKSVDHLALFYLDFLEYFDLQQVIVVGAGFGGWLANEIAIRDDSRIAKIVLIDPLGIKVGGISDRDIADMHSLSQDELAAAAYHNPDNAARDFSNMTDWELWVIARSREAYTFYGWCPYMHNPSLKHWLRRIKVPVQFIWGESDGIVSAEYGRAYAGFIPGSQFQLIAEAGHYPHKEQPEKTLEAIINFIG